MSRVYRVYRVCRVYRVRNSKGWGPLTEMPHTDTAQELRLGLQHAVGCGAWRRSKRPVK